MKLKGLSKIAIAGAALAATAATLGTSTYAWYVTNDTVSMTGVSGATKSGDIGANLVIAGNLFTTDGDAHGNWGPSAELTAASGRTAYETAGTTNDSKFLAEDLEPQSMDTAETSETWKNDKGTVITGKFIEFKLWLKNSEHANITPKFAIKNKSVAANLKQQTAYAPTGLPSQKGGAASGTAVAMDDKFVVDAVQALRVEIALDSATTYSTQKKDIYKLASIAKSIDSTGAIGEGYQTDTSIYSTGGDANQYYYKMMGAAPFNTGSAGASNASVYSGELGQWDQFEVQADEAVKISFRIWLEGADADCWDSCIAQQFDFKFEFTATKITTQQP